MGKSSFLRKRDWTKSKEYRSNRINVKSIRNFKENVINILREIKGDTIIIKQEKCNHKNLIRTYSENKWEFLEVKNITQKKS